MKWDWSAILGILGVLFGAVSLYNAAQVRISLNADRIENLREANRELTKEYTRFRSEVLAQVLELIKRVESHDHRHVHSTERGDTGKPVYEKHQ